MVYWLHNSNIDEITSPYCEVIRLSLKKKDFTSSKALCIGICNLEVLDLSTKKLGIVLL